MRIQLPERARQGRAGAGRRTRRTIAGVWSISAATPATAIPAQTSTRKWFAVAITQNQTQTGQSIQNAFAQRERTTSARLTPTIRASAAFRLGIAAYWFEANSISPLPWLRPPTP